MKNFKKAARHSHSALVLIFIIFCYSYSIAAENRVDKPGIKFSNTIFFERFSDILNNEERTQHTTQGDKPEFYINEKFQLYYQFVEDNGKTGCMNNCINNGCILVPPSSSSYISINFVYLYDENFAARTGGEIEWGSGNYKNPSSSIGFGLTSFHDMVFNSSQSRYPNIFLNFGPRDDMHIFINAAGNQIVFADESEDYINSDSIDISLGYKDFLPLFLRFNLFGTETSVYNIQKEEALLYEHSVSYIHLQYYGDHYGISAGYIYSKEEYQRKTWLNGHKETESKIGYKKSNGGGLTFYIKNSDSSFEVSGEFHILGGGWDRMTISKFGVKGYF